jgi:putative transferase (TIGR04331 family)
MTKKYILINTQNTNYWSKEGDIIFLGEWCINEKNKKLLENRKYKILEYHWNDREKFNKDYAYLEKVYEKYVEKLAAEFNFINNINNSSEYWRILISDWLKQFIDNLFDKYQCLKKIEQSYKISITLLPEEKEKPPLIIEKYTDEYQNEIISYIIKDLKKINYEEVKNKLEEEEKQFKLKKIIKDIKKNIIKTKNIYSNKILLKISKLLKYKILITGHLFLEKKETIKFFKSIKQFLIIYQGEEICFKKLNKKNIRDKIKLEIAENEFEKILEKVLINKMPQIFIEYHESYAKKIRIETSSKLKKIITAGSILNPISVNYLSAIQKEIYGTKLLNIQHGGSYTSTKYNPNEINIIKNYDIYYTWGLKLNESNKIKIMPSLRLLDKELNADEIEYGGNIMWVAARYDRYKTYADSSLSGPHMKIYINDQEKFLAIINENVKEKIYRRYRNDAWNEAEIFKAKYEWLQMQEAKIKLNQYYISTNFKEELRKCRLIICTCNETTMLESLSINFPTIIYWNKKYVEISAEAEYYFDRLNEVGILFYDPIEAANKVNEIFGNIKLWWNNKKIQTVREEFCEKLCYSNKNWDSIWSKELLSEENL